MFDDVGVDRDIIYKQKKIMLVAHFLWCWCCSRYIKKEEKLVQPRFDLRIADLRVIIDNKIAPRGIIKV